MKDALVILSGGQDSTTCLFWAINQGYKCSTITFDYNQMHNIEIQSAEKISKLAKVMDHELIDLGPLFHGDSPLTNKAKNLTAKLFRRHNPNSIPIFWIFFSHNFTSFQICF